MVSSDVPRVQSETERVFREDVAVRSYAATLHLPMALTKGDNMRKRRGNVRSVKSTCSRCGGCGHFHDRCNVGADAVIWGIDWSKRRKSRKRRREAQKRTKSAGMKTRGVESVKTHQSARAAQEPTMSKAATATRRDTADVDRC